MCSVPLITRDRTLGTLEIVRTTDDDWTDDDVEFLVQVAGQIAIAVENALSYRELSEMKERLATEKLYLEDEIRLDHNIGNMVGEGPAFQSVLKERSDRRADRCNRSHHWARQARERNSWPGRFTS